MPCGRLQRVAEIPLCTSAAVSAILCIDLCPMSTIWALAVFDFPFILGGTNGGVSGCLDFANTVFYRYTFGSGLNGKSDLGFGAAICIMMFLIMLLVTFIQNKVLSKFEYDN